MFKVVLLKKRFNFGTRELTEVKDGIAKLNQQTKHDTQSTNNFFYQPPSTTFSLPQWTMLW
jgi:hypothetical protein